ncbi:MAG: tripartite tricarboxylate transporter TctB family protein [Tissierella sp.]|uniref:tripartite tricarboxylate transporter TctB family protein n=1 Tax=Tissierella sp. TaxID=41274 RepID=UPI003F94BA90
MEKKSFLKNNRLIEGIVISLLSIFFIIESLKLHSGQSWALSPALFPLIITISILFFSVWLIIKSLKEERSNTNLIKTEGIMKLIFVIIISILYLVFLQKLHFLISSIIYLFLFLFILGERRWWLLGIISLITPVLIQYIFGNLLGVFLP